MYKIKLLILLLIKISLVSCVKINEEKSNNFYSIDYIGGGYNGVVLSNLLSAHLNGFGMLDNNSELSIKADITHEDSLFVTNINNTSDREKISSKLSAIIASKDGSCKLPNFEQKVSQFYIYAPDNKFLSNNKASKAIKFQNTEELVKKLINHIKKSKLSCLYE